MPIEIVEQDEKLVYEASGSKIFYRRIPSQKQSWIVKKHTKKGKTDWAAVTEDILKYITLGWDNVVMGKKAVDFEQDLLVRLPSDVINDLLELSGAESKEDEAKNFVTLSPSKSSTKSAA